MIAVQGVFFAVLTYVIKEVFLTACQSSINVVSYIVLGGAFVFFIATVFLLLQTIRPAKWFLWGEPPHKVMELKDYVMWFDNDKHDKFPTDAEDYRDRISKLDLPKMRENYEEVHFITLQLIRNKYKFYKPAALFMKLLVVWSAIGIIKLAILKWCPCLS